MDDNKNIQFQKFKVNKKTISWILLAFILNIFTHNSFAMCSPSTIRIYPNSKTISPNSIFMIEGYSDPWQSIIRNFNKGNKIYLISEKDTIPLQVIKILEGQINLTQATLRPISKLIPGKQYKFNIENLSDQEKESFEYKHIYRTVSDTIDIQKPIWKMLPIYNSKWMSDLGCGPEILVKLCANFYDKSAVFVYSKLRNLKSNSIQDYYIIPDSCSFEIGRNMCSGAFSFEEGQDYEATFTLMDASGNLSYETKPIRFTSPSNKYTSNKDVETENCLCSDSKDINQDFLIWIIVSIILFGLIFIFQIKPKFNSKKNEPKRLVRR